MAKENFFSRVLSNVFGRSSKASGAGLSISPSGSVSFIGSKSTPPRLGTTELLKSYNSMPWLRAVVNKVGQGVGSTSWRLFIRVSNNRGSRKYVKSSQLQKYPLEIRQKALSLSLERGEVEEIFDHPILDLLSSGNPKLLGSTIIKVTQQHIDLVGEAYWIFERNSLGVPIVIWPIPPDWVKGLPTKDSPFYSISFGSKTFHVPESEILAFIDPDPSNPYARGSGIAASLGDELEIDEFSSKHLKNFFFNRARPDLIISGEGLSREDTVRLEQKWLDTHQGFWNSFKPHFLNRKVEIKEVGQSFENMQITQLRKQERDTIMQVYGIPPEKLGVLTACHDIATECLTKEGFKKFFDLNKEDLIATLNPETHKIEYQHPTEIHIGHHKGTMHYWHDEHMNCLVTPNHRMYVKFEDSDKYEFIASDDLRLNGFCGKKFFKKFEFLGTALYEEEEMDCVRIPNVEDSGFYEIDALLFARFLGLFLAHGQIRIHRFSYVRISYETCLSIFGSRHTEEYLRFAEDIFSKIAEIVSPRPIRVDKIKDDRSPMYSYKIYSKSLYLWMRENVGFNTADRRCPRIFGQMPLKCRNEALKLFEIGRMNRNNGYSSFINRNLSICLALQDLAFFCGRRSTIDYVPSKNSVLEPDETCSYIVNVYDDDSIRVEDNIHSHFSLVDYDGPIWCVSVPNGIFITRRCGRIAIHGNSNRSTIVASDLFWTKDIILPRVELIRTTLQNRLIPQFDDRLILDFTSPIVEDKEHQLSVMRAMPAAFTVNEWRLEAGLPSLGPDGEVFIQQPGVIRVDSSGSATQIPPDNPPKDSPVEIDDIVEDVQKKIPQITSAIIDQIKSRK